MPQSPKRDPQFKWMELTDFSAGIFSNNNLAGGIEVTSTNLAIAQPTNTYGCRSLPTGGIGPLPRRKYAFTLTTPPDAGNSHTYIINGLNTWGFVLVGGGGTTDSAHRVEVHLVVGYTEPDGMGGFDSTVTWLRERIYEIPQATETIFTDSESSGTVALGYLYAYLLKTRMLPSDPNSAGVPVMVCIWTSDSQTLHINQAFPDPASAGTMSTIAVGTSDDVYRRAVAHQGRIALGLFASYGHGSTTSLSTDENVLWTNANTNTLSSANPAVFVPEVDQVIADWCSMSANQLVVVKRIGGGYVLQGDLDDVTVVRLPNLKSPDGTAIVKGANSPIGFIYSAGDSGLYLWNGGDQSEPISNQLDGKAFTDVPGIDRVGLVGQCDRWGELFLAPHGWAMDLETRAWWRIESPDQDDALTNPVMFWSASSYEGQVVGAARTFLDDEDCFWIYEQDDPAYTWSWQSHPLWASQDRYIDTREVLIAIEGLGRVDVTISNELGEEMTATFVSTSDSIRNHRSNIHMNAENLIIRIQATGVGYGEVVDDVATDLEAPTVHRLYIGFAEKQHYALTNDVG